jgi:hypothetical protein
MGRPGSALDSAAIEAWHSTLEFELRSRESFATKATARARVAAWIDEYKRERRRSALGMQTPINYELAHTRRTRAAPTAARRAGMTSGHNHNIKVSTGFRGLPLDAGGGQQDRDMRKLRDRVRRLQPLLGVRRRHPDVYDGQIPSVRSYEVTELLGVSGLTGHGKAGALEKPRHARMRKHIVVWDDDRIRLPEGLSRLWVTSSMRMPAPCANIAVGAHAVGWSHVAQLGR